MLGVGFFLGGHGVDPNRQQNEHDADNGKYSNFFVQYNDAADHRRNRLNEGGKGSLRRADAGDADIKQQEAERGNCSSTECENRGEAGGRQRKLTADDIDDSKYSPCGSSHVKDHTPNRQLTNTVVFIAEDVERVGKGRGKRQQKPNGLEAGGAGADDRDKQKPDNRKHDGKVCRPPQTAVHKDSACHRNDGRIQEMNDDGGADCDMLVAEGK